MRKAAFISVPALSIFALSACGDDVENPPNLSDIEDSMWDSMEDSDSVIITTDLSALDESGDMEMFFGGEDGSSEISIYGDADGSATGVAFGDEDTMLLFGDEEQVDEAYLAGSFMIEITEMFMGMGEVGDDEANTMEEMENAVEGMWLDLSDDLSGAEEITVREGILQSRDAWFGEATHEGFLSADDVSDDGVHEERDGEDVWVYAEGDYELVVEADSDAPRIVSMTADGVTSTFSDWDETEAPERPSDDDILTEQEFQDQMTENTDPDVDDLDSNQGLPPVG